MRRLLFFLTIVSLISCKKEIFTKNNDGTRPGNVLSIAEAQKFLKRSLKSTFSGELKKLASVNTADLSAITENMADSVYAKFYWDYAAEENRINGYPAILVPIIMQENINSSLVEGMSPKGYRVAVFQHNYEKDDIIVSFRDYHPDEQMIIARMTARGIPAYPNNFLEFYDLLAGDFSGHILHLDKDLKAIRLAKVTDNKIVKYLNTPFSDPADENPLIVYPYEDIFTGTDKECQVQIAYPDLEISYTRERFTGTDPLGQIGSNLTGMVIYGMAIGMRITVNYTTVWHTQTITVGCSLSSGGEGISAGVGSGGLPTPANPLAGEDCWAKKRIQKAMSNKLKLDSVMNALGSDGKSAEAGYNMTVKDLKKLEESKISGIYNDGDRGNVHVPFTWDALQGYVLHSTHSHPGGMPPSIQDIFIVGHNAFNVSRHPLAAEQGYKAIFQENYTDVIEAGEGKFYAITISNIDILISRTSGYSVSARITNLDLALIGYQDYLKDREETSELRLNYLLMNYGDVIRIYEGSRDQNGNLQELNRLERIGDNISSQAVNCDP
ncbi:hypothetical protein ACR79R_20745 [Sphingobacterium spiritivorum]|uniref:hypothetical protein n=2 Tax=Sphingobacterium spiritivorum TaxID=258 RepID=UPI003DA3CADD